MTPGPRSGSEIVNALTIDVEDYFHVSVFDGLIPRTHWDAMESRVCCNTERLLRLLGDAGVRGTFFVLGWVAERYPNLVRTIALEGHEVASHGYAHRLVYDMTPVAFRDDVRRAAAALGTATGQRVRGYRAPSYSVTPRSLWALDVLIEEGYTYDASIFPIHHDRYGIPLSPRHPYVIERAAGSIVELPGSTARWGPLNLPVGGGGYFRILPYAWTQWGIARLNEVERRPAIFYLHPWEIDPGQPRLPAPRLGQFRHYFNLDRTEARLSRLLAEFRFSTVSAVLAASVAPEPQADAVALPYVW